MKYSDEEYEEVLRKTQTEYRSIIDRMAVLVKSLSAQIEELREEAKYIDDFRSDIIGRMLGADKRYLNLSDEEFDEMMKQYKEELWKL